MCHAGHCLERGSTATCRVSPFFSPLFGVDTNDHLLTDLVSFSVPADSPVTLVLSRVDPRFFKGVDSSTEWNFDFKLFKEDDDEPIAQSRSTEQSWKRGTALEAELEEGNYVVHVRLERSGVTSNLASCSFNECSQK